MIIIQNVFLPLDTDFNDVSTIVSSVLKIDRNNIIFSQLYKKSVDARNKNNVCFCCSFTANLESSIEKKLVKRKNVDYFRKEKYNWQINCNNKKRPVVVGFGPAGMFAALLLARSGMKPLVLERGSDVDTRTKKIKDFFENGILDPDSNIQFGEGGAGTFSDGKLNTGIKNNRCRAVIEAFYEFGANEDILYDAKPHIGTDILCKIVKNFRNEIIKLGGQVCFDTKVTDLIFDDKGISGVIADGEVITAESVILCTGHSARDIFSLLKDKNVALQRKPFAMGVRIEHLQKDINSALYGDFSEHPALSAAPYKLAVHLDNKRGLYTFCMCPGGEVVNASSEPDGIAVNGMSYNARNGKNANSALLVGVSPEDLNGDDVLEGCRLQLEIEKKAYNIAKGKVPITTVGHFIYGEEAKFGKVLPTVKPETVFTDFSLILPEFICDTLKKGIPLLDKKLKGFADKEAILIAPETRSSSPVRILRNEKCECVSIKGLFPCGEGAGYAGGIVSAAVDGLLCAEELIKSIV